MINTLLGKESNIVTNIAGTTIDSIHTHYKLFGYDFMLTDTAGLRKKSKVNENLEFYSVMRTVRAIENSDVCLLLIDALKGFNAQDLKIFHLAEKNNKGVVILVNKWDTVSKDHQTSKQIEEEITSKISKIPKQSSLGPLAGQRPVACGKNAKNMTPLPTCVS